MVEGMRDLAGVAAAAVTVGITGVAEGMRQNLSCASTTHNVAVRVAIVCIRVRDLSHKAAPCGIAKAVAGMVEEMRDLAGVAAAAVTVGITGVAEGMRRNLSCASTTHNVAVRVAIICIRVRDLSHKAAPCGIAESVAVMVEEMRDLAGMLAPLFVTIPITIMVEDVYIALPYGKERHVTLHGAVGETPLCAILKEPPHKVISLLDGRLWRCQQLSGRKLDSGNFVTANGIKADGHRLPKWEHIAGSECKNRQNGAQHHYDHFYS